MLARLANDPAGTPPRWLAAAERLGMSNALEASLVAAGIAAREHLPAAPTFDESRPRPGQQRGPRESSTPHPEASSSSSSSSPSRTGSTLTTSPPRSTASAPPASHGRSRTRRGTTASSTSCACAPVRQARPRTHQRRARRSGQARDHRGRRPVRRRLGAALVARHRAPRRAGDARRARRPARPGSSSVAGAPRWCATCRSPACAVTGDLGALLDGPVAPTLDAGLLAVGRAARRARGQVVVVLDRDAAPSACSCPRAAAGRTVSPADRERRGAGDRGRRRALARSSPPSGPDLRVPARRPLRRAGRGRAAPGRPDGPSNAFLLPAVSDARAQAQSRTVDRRP